MRTAGRAPAAASWTLACLLVTTGTLHFIAVYPANITIAVDSLHGHGSVLLDWLRLPLQLPLLMWAIYIARHAGDGSVLAPRPVADPVDDEGN